MVKYFPFWLTIVSLIYSVNLFIIKPIIASTDINATVRISVCGDLRAEASEQCDNTDLRSNTCRSLGFFDGILACDPACDFNTKQCFGVAPVTPTPILAPTTTPTPISDNHNPLQEIFSQIRLNPTLAPAPVVVIPNNIITHEPVIATPLLPTSLKLFDINNDNIISTSEIYISIKEWVSNWGNYLTQIAGNQKPTYSSCDVNYDGICNIVDFSVIMSWVNQS
jgi:hypothetical protein